MFELIKYYEEPKQSYNIVSTAYYYSQYGYKDVDIYYNGIQKHLEIIKLMDEDWYLRIYFSMDETDLTKDGEKFVKLIEKLKKEKKVQMIEYVFKNKLYDSAIGMMVRLYPLFDFEDNNNLKTVLVRDIDIMSQNHDKIIKAIERMKQNNVQVMFRYYLSNILSNIRFISVYDYFHCNYIITCSLIVYNNYKSKKTKFINYLKSLIGNENNQYHSAFMKLKSLNYKTHPSYNIPYGTDELFMQFELENLIFNKIKIATLSTMNKYFIYDYAVFMKFDKLTMDKLYENCDYDSNKEKNLYPSYLIEEVNIKKSLNNLIKYKDQLEEKFGGFYKYAIQGELYDKYFEFDKDLTEKETMFDPDVFTNTYKKIKQTLKYYNEILEERFNEKREYLKIYRNIFYEPKKSIIELPKNIFEKEYEMLGKPCNSNISFYSNLQKEISNGYNILNIPPKTDLYKTMDAFYTENEEKEFYKKNKNDERPYWFSILFFAFMSVNSRFGGIHAYKTKNNMNIMIINCHNITKLINLVEKDNTENYIVRNTKMY